MKKLIPLAGAGAALVIVFGTIYAVGQQIQRSDANWPQVQMAEDTAADIVSGKSPVEATGGIPIDLAKSLAPFTNVYDHTGHYVAGNGYLANTHATPPVGILSASDNQDYHTITWQPQSNIRIAAVTVHAGNYYVLSGRSLTLVEKDEARTFLLSFVGGAGALFVVLLTLWAHSLVKRKAARRKR